MTIGGTIDRTVAKAKAAVPGTTEHKMTHPTTTTGTTGMGAGGANTHMHATNAHTTHTGGIGIEAQKAKVQVASHIPGTAEHKATHPTHTTGGTMANIKSKIPGTTEHKITHGTGANTL